MVAATFINPSYEDNDGIAGVLLGGGVEPYLLTDNDTLSARVDTGDVQNIVFEIGSRSTITSASSETFTLADLQTLFVSINGAASVTIKFATANFVDITNATAIEVVAELLTQLPGTAFAQVVAGQVLIGSLTKGTGSLIDVTGGTAAAAFAFPAGSAGVDFFVDISAATAAEVSTRINAQMVGATAADNGGQVELTTVRVGDDACVEVIGGTAFTAFSFPAGVFCGQGNPGTAQGWTVVSTASLFEYAEWSTGLVFPGAYEEFTLGWPTSPGAEGDTSDIDPNFFTAALFDVDQIVEPFVWFGDSETLPATAAAPFNAALIQTTFEAFDQGWPGIPGSEADVTVLGVLDDALFDVSQEDKEDFEEGWKGNEGDGSTLQGLTLWTVGQGGNAETFQPFSEVHTDVQISAKTTDHIYVIEVLGIPFSYKALVGDTQTDIATNLAQLVDNGPIQASATSSGIHVLIVNESTGQEPFEVGTSGTAPTEIGKVFDLFVQPDVGWTGAEQNNFC